MAAAAPAIRFYFDRVSSNGCLRKAAPEAPEGHALEAVFAP